MAQGRVANLIIAAMFLISLTSATVAHGGGRSRRFVKSHDYDSPCKQMKFYFHNILYDYNNSTTNSTSAVVASPASLLSAMKNASVFGTVTVFNDPMTEGKSLPPSLEETAVRAQGLYLYDTKKLPANAWFAFSVVFNSTETAVRAQGLYMYDTKKAPGDAWFAFSIVFNSPVYGHGTINLIGADIISQKARDFSVVGGTGDFFMARGVATVQGDEVEGFTYFRLLMDIKLYECYV
uniref:Dirigent protein n=1 Tax=Leersia perrieri TaxID=77586 RepID=A0A0D9X1Z8_9ORYZ